MTSPSESERKAMEIAKVPPDLSGALDDLRKAISKRDGTITNQLRLLLERVTNGDIMLIFAFNRTRSSVTILTAPQQEFPDEASRVTTNTIAVSGDLPNLINTMDQMLSRQRTPAPLTFANVVVLEKNRINTAEQPLRLGQWNVHTAQQNNTYLHYNELIHAALSSS